MSSIKVSIIIPVYNGAQSIVECLSTCRAQTLDEIEIICIDDGSTDNSAEIIQNLIHEDARIHLIQQENQGPGPARNEGMKVAAGEYIAFMDADDKYPSVNTLEHMYSVAKTHEALICGGSFFSENGKFRRDKFDGTFAGNTFNEEGWIEFKAYQYDYAFYRFIYSRKFLTENNLYFPKYQRYEDPPFMTRAFTKAGKFYALPDITYHHIIYQHFSWTLDKVYDLLSGIEDNLIFSVQNEYKQLFMLNYNRICSDFCNTIVNVALKEDSKGIIIRKLLKIQNLVNAHPQMNDGYFTDETFLCSVPLDSLFTEISQRSFQSAELKKKVDSAKKEAEAAKHESALSRKDVDVARKEREIAKRDAEIVKKDSEIAKRDAALARSEAYSAKVEADQARQDVAAARKEADAARSEAAEARKA
ncbi:MAG: glycosyltransferase, partial [Clostridia bacterium]|nr:glycosyltransferase [Clostridia bacterium]